MRGVAMESGARALVESRPELEWLGFWHLHFGLSELSAGDMQELARLHDSGRHPSCGIIMILAIKNGSDVRLRAWKSMTHDELLEAELLEADDPTEARRSLSTDLASLPMQFHTLGLPWGASRLKDELAALEAQGVIVTSRRIMRHGIELTFAHACHEGLLRCTLGGWEQPPKTEMICRGQSRLVLSPLGSLLASWSSAFTLADLAAYARARGVWPRKASTPVLNP